MKNEKDMTNVELLEQLVYYGCDGYYEPYWSNTIKELEKRLNITEEEHKKIWGMK